MQTRGAIGFWATCAAVALFVCAVAGCSRSDADPTAITPIDQFDEDNPLGVPDVDVSTYRLRIAGEVDRAIELTYADLLALPAETRRVTMHAMNGPSRIADWTGVPLRTLLDRAGVHERADRLVFLSENDMSTSIPVADGFADGVLLATHVNGEVLTPQLGYPVRLVAEGKYSYKWARWVREIRIIRGDHRGFWEVFGYDPDGDVSHRTPPIR